MSEPGCDAALEPGLWDRAVAFFGGLQGRICDRLAEIDGAAGFREDRWEYGPGRGEGATRTIAGGAVFEKGGVGLSAVEGRLSEKLAERLKVSAQRFRASGVSLVLHPRSPRIPTTHMNVRYIELPDASPGKAWFGGGADLTPYYLDAADVGHFHGCFKDACDRHDPDYYPRFKTWCDDYFRLPHRDEARGVGGIFFDYLEQAPEKTFEFVQDVGNAFLEAYPPIVERHRSEPWSNREREWQEIRRGRYVEFNLIHDRGTLFGLETGGRTESILMSLPPVVRWNYDHHPEPDSPEAELLELLRRPRAWV